MVIPHTSPSKGGGEGGGKIVDSASFTTTTTDTIDEIPALRVERESSGFIREQERLKKQVVFNHKSCM